MNKKLLFGLVVSLLTFSSGAHAQFNNRGITFKGNVTQGHCPTIVDSYHLEDSGAACGGSGGTSPGGSNTDVQFNMTGVFGGNSGFTYDGVSGIGLGTTGTSTGVISFYNQTSGKIGLTAPTGALGTNILTLPDVTDTLVGLTATQTLTNKTLTSPNVNGGWLNFTNTASNVISYALYGTAVPGSGSVGEKIQLYGTPGSVSANDYAIGIAPSSMWFNGQGSFDFYATGVNIASLSNAGVFSASNFIASSFATAGIVTNAAGGLFGSEATLAPAQCPVATTSAIGCVKPDGTTISIAGDGTLSVRSSNVPGGDNAEVQYNNNGAFGGSPNFTYGPLTGSLLLAQGTNNIDAPSITFRNTSGQAETITVNLSAPLGSHNVFLPSITADDTFAVLGTPQVFTATQTIDIPNISFNGTAGLDLYNPTAATSSTTQASPRVRMQGNGWSTNSAASQPVEFDLQTRPVDGTTISGSLTFLGSVNGGSESQLAALSSGGLFFTIGGLETLGNLQFDASATNTISYASSSLAFQRQGQTLASLDNIGGFYSNNLIAQGTTLETPVTGQVLIAGNIVAPTLTVAGTGLIYNSLGGGLKLQGDGQTNDFTLVNSAPNNVAWIAHGATVFTVQNLAIVGQGVGILNVINGSGTVQSIAGVTCSGVPSLNFAITNGIVTHC